MKGQLAYRKKFLVFTLGAVAILLNRYLGISIAEEQIVNLVDMLLLVATGLGVERAANQPQKDVK